MNTDHPPAPTHPDAQATLVSHRHIEVFRAVMTAGSVTSAAALLHSSQPTVSRELARLEQLLGYPLFERLQGRLRPNARALALWDEVQRSWQGLERVVERAVALGQSHEAQLSVLCLPALAHALLPGAIARMLKAQPQLRVSITPQESPLLEEWMSAQRFDLGLSEQAATPPGVQAVPLLTLDEVAVLPAGHALAAQAVLQVQDFANQPLPPPDRRALCRGWRGAPAAPANPQRRGRVRHGAARPGAGHRQPAHRPGHGGVGAGGAQAGVFRAVQHQRFAAAVPPSLARSAAAAAVPRGPSPGSDRRTAALAEPACELTRRKFLTKSASSAY